ncbi:CarD family transcriptional regulator [Bacillus aerius]|uniref:CarD family transcriptional regulator n=1 Tax=Bacillus aerius TaxID=293388 RepID=UPI00281580DB|nr:CarD family transcriptional regulator [Bacillus aerius]WMT27715.1 CarD family transcriptional regulator [Bacillus aerius]
MFQIGDKIVYPMHGAGVIEGMEEKEILGKTEEYFLIQMPNMQMMVPRDRINQLGIRPVADQATLKVVMNNFAEETNDDTLTWKQRYDENLKKLKTGSIEDGADVVKDLMRRNQKKALNSSEKKMLEDARGMLVSEISLAQGLSQDEVLTALENELRV